jgi:hypothetical protein
MVKSGDIIFLFNNNTYNYPKKIPISEIAKEIYETINKHFKDQNLINLVDFGGVAEHFLGGRGDNNYIENPPTIKQNIPSFIFSFLPSNQKFEESTIMHETGLKSGFAGTIITTKKFGNKGKSDFVNEFSKWIHLYYYEDTSSILDETTEHHVNRIWVQPDVTSEFHNTYPNDKTIQIMSMPNFLTAMLET